ncbi:MAG: DUF2141 domain-containing protein [Ignavibacteriales bacterium]|nr:DUF2141 domain-containing protein [Ignavibacteriales bacterium]
MFFSILVTFILPRPLGLQEAQNIPRGKIIVTMSGFRGTKGHARIALFNSEEGFPSAESKAFRGTVAAIIDGRVRIEFDSLAYGGYAVAMYHDENDDGTLDSNFLGIPSEGYGVSNNIVHALSAPKFKEALIQLDQKEKELTINVHY